MIQRYLPLIGLALAVLIFVLTSAAFRVQEGTQAVVLQFGKPVGDPITEAGLYFKIPIIQEARILEKRILNWDGQPRQMPTRDKKYILVDTTARWRISDPLKFIKTVRDERRANSRITVIVDAKTRDIISNENLVEAVRNSNAILEEARRRTAEREQQKLSGADLLRMAEEEEITGEIEPVSVGREKLSATILDRAKTEIEKIGVELIDVQLRRIAYEKSVEEKAYQRMISERKRIAEKIRSIGKGEVAKIQGKTEKDLQEIQSEAYRRVQAIKGEAEARSIKIYAAALEEDPEFYKFIRTLEAYQKSLRGDTRYLLSSESEFLNLMRSGHIND